MTALMGPVMGAMRDYVFSPRARRLDYRSGWSRSVRPEQWRLAALGGSEVSCSQFIRAVNATLTQCGVLCAVPVAGDVVAVGVVVDTLAAANADVGVLRYGNSLSTPVAGFGRVAVGAVLHVVQLASLEGIHAVIRHVANVRSLRPAVHRERSSGGRCRKAWHGRELRILVNDLNGEDVACGV